MLLFVSQTFWSNYHDYNGNFFLLQTRQQSCVKRSYPHSIARFQNVLLLTKVKQSRCDIEPDVSQ